MFALTTSKLERASRAQLLGGRSSSRPLGSLRELVLLSNVWGMEAAHRREAETRRRREEEERWLQGVLEEMLEEYPEQEGEDAEEEDFVSLRLVAAEQVGDSGFLEEVQGQVKAEQEEKVGLDRGLEDLRLVDSAPHQTAYCIPLPPSPPRSPPIPLTLTPRRSTPSPPPTCDCDDSSPPLHPPALTPDSTPPFSSTMMNLLGTSADSVESELREEDPYQWILREGSAEGTAGLHLQQKLDETSLHKQEQDEEDREDVVTLSLLRDHPSPRPPSPSSSSSLALILASPQRPQYQQYQPVLPSSSSPNLRQERWTPRPPRSLTPPRTPTPVTWQQGGIGKSFYDCVEYVNISLPILRWRADAPIPTSFGQPLPPSLSLYSSSSYMITTEKDKDDILRPSSSAVRPASSESMALILHSPPSPSSPARFSP